MYDELYPTEPCNTGMFEVELEAYSEPCQIPMMKNSQPCVTLA